MAPVRASHVSKTITINAFDPAAGANPGMAEFKEQVATDTSNWNSLLRWHRRSRGPQWDYSTGM